MLKFLLAKTKLSKAKSSPVPNTDSIEFPTYFVFFPENTKNENKTRKRVKSLAQTKTENIVMFYQIESTGALWKLWVSPAKLVTMLSFTKQISFFGFKKSIIRKDIYFFKQLGKFASNLKKVIFLDTDSEELYVNQQFVISATACLMKRAVVSLEEQEEDEYASDGESKQIWERPYEIHEEAYLLMYKLLRASDGLDCLMNHNGKIISDDIIKLFGAVCLNNSSQLTKLRQSIKEPDFNPLAVFLFRT